MEGDMMESVGESVDYNRRRLIEEDLEHNQRRHKVRDS